jgi:hypothetical protein
MIRVPVTLDSANRKKDRSVSMKFTTNFEVNSEDFLEMDKLVMSSGWLIFAENEVDESDVPKEPAALKEGKPKIQRLRAVAWLLHQKTTQEIPFEVWWDSFFEGILDHYKERLD